MSDAKRAVGPSVDSFEADPAAVYSFVDRFFASLAASGLEHVCVSPGSRSSPLAISADRTPGLRTWIGLDERATSFFALGLAKATRRPVAIVCTSGTAAANYLPAIVEAHYSRVPLLVLTADRPPELRGWGAGQTIEQPGLYGRYPRWAVEVPLPSGGSAGLRYATQLAARAVDEAGAGPRGPVHLNWPLREPLAPPAQTVEESAPTYAPVAPGFSHSARIANDSDVDALVAMARGCERGVISTGPMDPEPGLIPALAAFSVAAGWPVLAGPASQLRGAIDAEHAPVLTMGDGFLRAPGWSERMRPEVVIRIGETPVSKIQRLWIEAGMPDEVWWLDEGWNWGEPSHRATRIVRGGAASLLWAAAKRLGDNSRRDRPWCRAFESAEAVARRVFDKFVAEPRNFCGLSAAFCTSRGLAGEGTLFASNSMSIRLLDLACDRRQGPIRVLCNRGASGIDGITSTALGVAASGLGRTVLLTGDLALLHDLSGLVGAKQVALDLVIVVLDDDGGGIFAFLPIAERAEAVGFERLFGTPHGLDLARVAALFELDYARVTSTKELDEAVSAGLRRGGISLVHVPLDRKQNEARFRMLLAGIATAVDAEVSV